MTDDKQKDIYGEGGGGGRSRRRRRNPGGGGNTVVNQPVQVVYPPVYTPTYTNDDAGLKSTSWAQIQYMICEGEVEGPAFGNTVRGLERSVYLDETPLSTGSAPVPQPTDLMFTWGKGPGAQSAAPGYQDVTDVISVNQVVEKAGPVSAQVNLTDNLRYTARVILTWSGLVRQTSKGDVLKTAVKYRVQFEDNDGNNNVVFDGTLNSKFSSQFQRDHEFALTGNGPWVITVYRDTADDQDRNSSTDQYQSTFSFTSVSYSLDQGLKYPYTSMLSVGLRADNYGAIPDCAILLKGLKIKVPANYNPATRAYAGSWNGTFKVAYTDNPAWIFYDMCTNDRYGLGKYIEQSQVDKWSLYEIGKICDEMVPSAAAGVNEPRFTCNLALQTSEQAWQVLQQLSSVFRGLIYYAGGTIVATQDYKGTPVFAFNQTNTIQQQTLDGKVSTGNFSYSGTAQRARHTACLVSFDDPNDLYQPRTEYVADDKAIERLGYRPLDLRAFGVTSRGQAIRVAQWALLSEKLLTDTVTFSTNEIGLALRPGDLIKITDPYKDAARFGGRITDVDFRARKITVDQIPPTPGGGWTSASSITWMSTNADGDPVMIERSIASVSGNEVTWSGALPSTPPLDDFPFLIETPNNKARQYRIIAVSEDTGNGIYNVTALEHDESIYDKVDNQTGYPSQPPQDTTTNPDSPNLYYAEFIQDIKNVKIDARWRPPTSNTDDKLSQDPTVSHYVLQYRSGEVVSGKDEWNDTWVTLPDQKDNAEVIELKKFQFGEIYQVRVKAVNTVGDESPWSYRKVGAFTDADLPDLNDRDDQGDLKFQVTHINQPSGSQLIKWTYPSSEWPLWVDGIQIWVQPDRVLTETEEKGLAPPVGGWYFVWEGPLERTYKAVTFHAITGWDVRLNLKTSLGLTGSTYGRDRVEQPEIQPPTPTGFKLVYEGFQKSKVGQKRLTWEMPDPPPYVENWPRGYVDDLKTFHIKYIKDNIPSWEYGTMIDATGLDGSQRWLDTSLFDKGTWTVMIKSVDQTDWESDNYAYFTTSITDEIPTNVVEKVDMDIGAFNGVLENFEKVVEGGKNVLRQIDPSKTSCFIAEYENPWTEGQILLTAGTTGTSTWSIKQKANQLAAYIIDHRGNYFVSYWSGNGAYTNKLVAKKDNVRKRRRKDLFKGASPRNVNSNATPIWSKYAPNEQLKPGSYLIRLCVDSKDGVTPAKVTNADLQMDYPDRTTMITNVSVPATGRVVSFAAGTFNVTKGAAITVRDDESAPGVAITGKTLELTANQIKVCCYDKDNKKVAGVVDIYVVGY